MQVPLKSVEFGFSLVLDLVPHQDILLQFIKLLSKCMFVNDLIDRLLGSNAADGYLWL
jgi:hypothetical protein